MKLPLYQVDAFADRLFTGNPAAVVILHEWLPDPILQSIAAENNLSETAFVVPADGAFGLRWFSPLMEIDLCGHATLAGAHVLFCHGYTTACEVTFRYPGGTLSVTNDGDRLSLFFPSRPPSPVPPIETLTTALGRAPREWHKARDLMAVFDVPEEIESMKPDFALLAAIDMFAVIVTAPGRHCDFVSRFFAPRAGIPEDPVTGSAHCTLIPYWSRRLGKKSLHARQASPRGGELFCEDLGDRVRIAGRAIEYLQGTIDV